MLVSDPGTHSFREEEMVQWDEQANSYELERVKDQVYMAGIEGAAAALAPQDHDVVLDAGCGTGLTIKQYIRPSIQVVAFDLSMDSLRCLRAQNFSIPKKRAGWRKQGTAKASSGPVQYIYRFDPAEFQDLLRSTMQVDSLFGAGLPLPYRFKLSRLSRLAEKALRRFRLSSYWGNMIVGACRKGENLLVTQDD
jgi:SAM-dependent methyltransferase